MPRVNIRELDLTGSDNRSYIENIALIPAVKIELRDEDGQLLLDDNGKELTLDGTYENISAFEAQVANIFNNIPEEPESGEDPYQHEKELMECFVKDKGYAIAFLTLNSGLPIEYGGLYDVIITKDQQGSFQITPNYENVDIEAFYDKYADRGNYDVKFISIPSLDEISDKDNAPAQDEEDLKTRITKAAINTAAKRADAFALIALDSTYKTAETVNAAVQNMQDFLNTGIEREGVTWSSYDNTEVKGSYAAIFSPNFMTTFTVTSPLSYLVEGKKVAISYKFDKEIFPAFVNYLVCFGKYTRITPDWFAISGSIRGVTPLSLLLPLNRYGDADINLLQTRSAESEEDRLHVAVNTIANIKPYGNIIWGNRTMHPLDIPSNGSSDTVQLVASDFLNIRSLICDIKKTLYRAARRYSFDPNSDNLWINFKSAITPLLERMKSNDGIRDYLIVKVPTAKKALLAARIIISPVEAVEDFDLTIELNDSIEVVEN